MKMKKGTFNFFPLILPCKLLSHIFMKNVPVFTTTDTAKLLSSSFGLLSVKYMMIRGGSVNAQVGIYYLQMEKIQSISNP